MGEGEGRTTNAGRLPPDVVEVLERALHAALTAEGDEPPRNIGRRFALHFGEAIQVDRRQRSPSPGQA